MNPELQRNLWLQATPRKLALAGAVLAGVFVAVWLIDRGRHASAVTFAGAFVFAVSALAWGPRAARASVTGEAAAGSWDFQRLTAMTPFEMTWGKLAGSTVRAWATAAGGLAIVWLQLASTAGVADAVFWLIVAIALAVTLQASGLATGLIDIRRARAAGRPLSTRAPGLVLIALALLSVAVLAWARASLDQALNRFELGRAGEGAMAVSWFGQRYRPLGFATATLLALAAWSVLWAWRLMRLELQHVNAPWAWGTFLACAGLYALGFDPDPRVAAPFAARLAAAAGVWAVLAYVAAFAGPADRVRARQFAAAVRDRRPGRALSRLPLVILPSSLTLAAGALVALLRARSGEAAAALVMLAAMGFFARDLGVVAWRRFAGARGDAGVLLILLALYVLAGPLAWVLAHGRGLALFWPAPEHARLNLAAAMAQAALAWALAAIAVSRPAAQPRVRRWTPPSAPPPTAVPPTGN